MADLELLKDLCIAPGAPGFEKPVTDIVAERLKGFTDQQYDGLGSLSCELKSETAGKKRIMIEAHADEVGFMVQDVTRDGYIKLQSLGGWVSASLQGTAFIVYPRAGEPVFGTIGCIPSHFTRGASGKASMPQVDDMILDIGAVSDDAVYQLGINIGDPICAYSGFHVDDQSNTCMSKAFDNRVGCSLVTEVITHFKDQSLNNTLIGGISVQEEVGARGAVTLAALTKPDLCIVLEGAPADDYPGLSSRPQTAMGKGAHVRLYDPTFIPNAELKDCILDVAAREKITIQPTVRKVGGTDAPKIAANHIGVPTIVIGVPVRYAHGPMSVIHLDDYDHCLALLKAVVSELDKAN